MIRKLLFILVVIFSHLISKAQKTGSQYSIDLDGTDDYIALADNNAINPSDKLTVEAWIKADAYSTTNFGNSILCKHGWASGNKGYVLRCGDNGKLGFNIASSSGVWMESLSASLMKTGVWYHVAGVFTGDSVNTYINGVLTSTTLYSGAMSPSVGLAPKIGDLAYGNGRYFNGQIDEVRIWNTALPKSEIRNWMCRKINSNHPYYSNLGGYWKLDEASGSDANDQTSNKNTGTLTGGAQWASSGAVIGDTSVHVYGGGNMVLPSKFGDILTVSKITGNPDAIHAVVNYGTTQQSVHTNAIGILDSSHFFTVYHSDNSSVNYSLNYNFKNYSKVSGIKKCAVNLLQKTLVNAGTWNYSGARFYDNGDSIVGKGMTKGEFITAFYPTDSNTLLSSVTGLTWFCGGDSLLLNGNGNDSFNYTWYKNGNVIQNKTKKSIYVNSSANYKLKMTRKGSNCSFNSTGLDISMRNTTVTWSNNVTLCQNNDSVMLSGGSPSGGFYTGKWVTSNGYFHPKRANVGANTIIYNYQDTNNCINKASSIYTLKDTTKLSVTAISETCFNNKQITLNAVSPAGGTYKGKGVTGNVFDVFTAGIGTHTINYTYTHSNSCVSKALVSIKVNKPDSISIKIKDKACIYDAPIEIATYPTGGTIIGSSVIGKNFYPPFATPGYQWVYYKIKDSHQCDLMDSAKIYIAEATKAGFNRLSSVCDNASDIVLTGGTPKDSGQYYFNNKVTSVFSPKTTGKGLFKVEYKVINKFGCRDSATVSIRVNASPVKPVINFSNNSLVTNSTLKHQWLDKNGDISGATQSTFKPTKDGYYSVRITNDSNCSIISDSFEFKKVGIKSIVNSNVKIYPNPSHNGFFNIDGLTSEAEIVISNFVGQTLKKATLNSIEFKLDLSSFSNGNYYLSVTSDKGFSVFLISISKN